MLARVPLLLVSLIAGASLSALPASPARVQDRAEPIREHSAADAWLKLQKLRTTASLMHTTAHPDDEHGGMLARVSHGQGARVSLLTLTRGESGDNAIGPELFDALGLIRTEELLLAGRHYGVDAHYFTRAADYGFSKRLDEAVAKWGLEDVLRDVVAIIRIERPLVIVSRFQGNARDGHGQHQAAGLLTVQAFEASGDPARFPEQIASGLRPWQPRKLYIGGVREGEPWTVRVDAGTFNPVIGETYATLGRLGLSLQRSQTAGRFNPEPGPSYSYYQRLAPASPPAGREESFFDGIDTSIAGIHRMLARQPPPGVRDSLATLERAVDDAVQAFTIERPSAAAPALSRAMAAAGSARAALDDPDATLLLDHKAQQIADAMHAVLGVALTAVAQPAGTPEAAGPFATGPPPLGPVVPGRAFEVRASFTHRGAEPVDAALRLVDNDPRADWQIPAAGSKESAAPGRPVVRVLPVIVPAGATLTRPHFSRASIQDSRYSVDDESSPFPPFPAPPLDVVARYEVAGVAFEMRRGVTRLEPNLPYGHETRRLAVVPPVSIAFDRSHVIVPIADRTSVGMTVQVVNNVEGPSDGVVSLVLPSGWHATPADHAFSLTRAGERTRLDFQVDVSSLDERAYDIEAVASSGGREYREGYAAIRHRDLETRYLYRRAAASVRGVDVRIAPGLRVGYVMGIGDDVPAGLAQLGVDVRMLGASDLAEGDLSAFDAIMTGTRAYAVREDLRTHNRRLLQYVEGGGHLIVLYNTQELVPDLHAPYPGQLPRSAEEVSEEDSPVEILAPDHPVFNTPNRITQTDFDGWIEQRGSKFWSAWDDRYTALVATRDTEQAPQKGGWLYARHGKGQYTYFAYALHRQLPYGVPGAYRLLANLLSLR